MSKIKFFILFFALFATVLNQLKIGKITDITGTLPLTNGEAFTLTYTLDDGSTTITDTTFTATFREISEYSQQMIYSCTHNADDGNFSCSCTTAPPVSGYYFLDTFAGDTQKFSSELSNIIVKLNGIDQVMWMLFSDAQSCSATVNNIIIKTVVKAGNNPTILLKRKSDSSTVQCAIVSENDNKITCYADLTYGSYELFKFGDNFDLSLMYEPYTPNRLTIASSSNPVSTVQTSPFEISSGTTEFSFELTDAAYFQNFFLNNDENNVLSCEHTDGNTTVTCTTGNIDIDFSEAGTFGIYYKGCSGLIDTGLSVTIDVQPVEIIMYSFADGRISSIHEVFSIKFQVSSASAGITRFTFLKEGTSDTITFDAEECSVENKFITCTASNTIEKGSYKLTQIEGSKTYTIAGVAHSVNYLESTYKFSEENVGQTQYIGGSFNKIYILLSSDEDFNMPHINLDFEHLTCEHSELLITCDAPADEGGKKYDLVYREPKCICFPNIGITIVYQSPNSLTISEITFSDGTQSTADTTTSLVFTTSVEAHYIKTVTLKQNDIAITFSSCTAKGTKVTCTKGDFSTAISGSYQFDSTESIDTIALADNYSPSLYFCKTTAKALDSAENQINVQEVSRSNRNVKFLLKEEITESDVIPKFYLGNDNTNELTCEYIQNKEVSCSVGDLVDLTQVTEYEIYYLLSDCSVAMKTSVKVKTNPNYTITVQSVKFSDGTTVNEMNLKSIALNVDLSDLTQDDVTGVTLTNQEDDTDTLTFSCQVTTSITCQTEGSPQLGTYKITLVSGSANTYTFDQANTLKYIDPIISRTEPYKYQEVSTKLADFSIEFVSNDTTAPKFYLGLDDQKELTCTGTNPLTCTVPETEVGTEGTHTIYYKTEDGKFVSTGIEIKTGAPREVFVGSVKMKKDLQCTDDATNFDTIIITGSGYMGKVSYIELTSSDSSHTVKYSDCPIKSGIQILCSGANDTIIAGSYKISAISSVNNFNSYSQFTLKLSDGVKFGTQNGVQSISRNYDTVVVVLGEDETTVPALYLNEADSNLLSCEQEEKKLTCKINDTVVDLDTESTNEITYKNACGFMKVGVQVKVVIPKNIKVESITTSTQTCPSTPFSLIGLTCSEYLNLVTGVIFLRESDNSLMKLNCHNDHATIICNNEEEFSYFPEDSYVLDSVIGIDNFSPGDNLNKFVYRHYPFVAHSTSITLTAIEPKSPTFSVELINENEPAQKIYFSETDESQEFDCAKEGSAMVCKVNSTSFSDNQGFSLYYKNGCGTLTFLNIYVKFLIAKEIAVESVGLSAAGKTCFSDPTNTRLNMLKLTHAAENDKREIYNATIERIDDGTQYTYKCTPNSNTVTYCDIKEASFTYGTYRLASVEGINNFVIGDNVNTLSIEKESFSSSQSKTAQTVKKSSPSFTVDLIEDSVSIPEIYAGNDSTKKITCEKKENILECTPDTTVMPESKDYEIFYRAPCAETLTSTGITVTHILPKSLTVTDIAVKGTTESCVTSDISEIVITVNEKPTGDTYYLWLGKVRDDYNFTTCVLTTDTEITCSGLTLTEEGVYKVIAVNGDDSYITSALKKNIIIDKSINPIDSADQTGRQRINKKMNTFTIKTLQGASKPSIYIDEEGTTEVTCDDIADNSMVCHIDNTVLTETKDYTVYYKGVCGKISPAGITLESSLAVDVAVNSFVIPTSENEICSREPITQIKLTTNSTQPKEVESIVLAKEGSDFSVTISKCVTTDDYVTCTIDDGTTVETGTYKLTEVNGVENNFIITAVESKTISYEVDYISVANEVTYQINNEKVSFELHLTKLTSDVALYVETKDKLLPCTKKEDLLYECTPNDTVMPTSKTYELFYVPSCRDALETTNIKVEYSVTIKTTGFALADSKVCSKEEIASIVITTDKKPTQDIESAVIAHTDGSQFTFNTCTYSETTVTCTDLATELKRGEYKLHSVNGKDSFVTSELEATIKYDPEMISTETKLDPTVDRENEKFTITLTDSNIEPIKFFIGNTQDVELSCEQSGAEAVCTTNDEIMPTNDDYEIYYISSCGQFGNTNIVVKREKVFSAIKITLPDEQLCMVEPFASIIVTLDAKPTSAITSATITDSVNEYKFTTCVDDEETHTIITCSSPDKNILAAKYTLLSMEGPDTYNVSLVQETIVKYEVDPLGTQSISQTIDNDTKTFTVELASEKTDQPVIFINEEEPMVFNCTKESTTLTCDYNETYMSENGEYEILYEGACRIPGTTNIKVTRLLPVTVTSVSIGAEEAVCTGEGINEITITTDIKPFTDVSSIIVTDESTDYTIENCTVSETTVTCSTPVSQIEYGVYKIKEVDAGEVYDVEALNMTQVELKYEEDPLGVLSIENESYFVIDNDTLSFTFKGENIKELPKIYAGNDATREIACEFADNETTTITCTPDNVNMDENIMYEIYYEGPCGVLKSTGITVENKNAPVEKDPELTIETKGDYLFISKIVLSIIMIALL